MTFDLSVIIPVYNGATFIAQAIESVLSQKGVNTEVIVINDGSTDGTTEVLRMFESQISVYAIEHCGASGARNFGLRKAMGKYVMFLDADDFLLDEDICRECIEQMEHKGLDMAMFSYQYQDYETGVFMDSIRYDKNLERLVDGGQLFYKMIRTGAFPASPCFRIIQRGFLLTNNLFFQGRMIAEDIEWFVRLIIASKRFCIINKPAYIYRKNVPNSVTSSMNFEKCRQFLWMIRKSLESIKNVNDSQKQEALYGSMAYEYCILLGNVYNVPERKVLRGELKELSWLLDYDLFPRIMWAKWIYRLLGHDLTSSLFAFYIRHFSKSNR